MPNTNSRNLRSLRWASWLGIAVLMLATSWTFVRRHFEVHADPQTKIEGAAQIVSKFSLVDQSGKRVTEASFAGRWQLIYFGYTNCPDVCPATLAYLSSVLDDLGTNADRVAPIFITVDPKRDTPAVMAAYVAAFSPRLVGLTGGEDEVAKVEHSFRVYSQKSNEPGSNVGYEMAHSSFIYLMTPKGDFDAIFLEARQTAREMSQEILMRIKRNNKS